MNLSLRLEAVKSTVEPSRVCCDIGCDHGYVSISLINEGLAEHCIACDINEGPLKAARENISNAGLSDKIETRLSDGLHKIDVSDNPDSIVIAGMGGRLMVKILDEGEAVVNKASQLVLQPQSELFLVRQWVRKKGFFIKNEKIVLDAGKYYFIMNVSTSGSQEALKEPVPEVYDYYSEYLIKEKNELLREYLYKGLSNNRHLLKGISPDKQEGLIKQTELIETALGLMGESI